MSQDRETNLALFIDFDNVALGARDMRQRFDINHVLGRLLEKGRIIMKKAYADWSYYPEYMGDLHAAAIELIEVPSPRVSGKNSADIRLVVDALDLCYSNNHIDTFVIVSGDSDFSPLVSKLRENAKSVIGIGVRGSSSKLLISNCDDFIFYDDLMQKKDGGRTPRMDNVPAEKKKLFSLLVSTIQGLMLEHKGPLYSSLVKDTMKRKKPDFNESNWNYSSFGDVLEDAMALGLLTASRDEQAGGTWVVTALGFAGDASSPRSNGRKSSRRRSRRRSSGGAEAPAPAVETDAAAAEASAPPAKDAVPAEVPAQDAGRSGEPDKAPAEKTAPEAERAAAESAAPAKKPSRRTAARKTAKKAASTKKTTKKAVTKKAATKKTTKKTATRKTAAKKTTAKKATKKAAPKTSDSGSGA